MEILQYIITIVSCIIVYKIFEKSSVTSAIVFKIILQLILFFVDSSFTELHNQGLPTLTLAIILFITLVITLIFTLIEYAVYNRTNSFFSYLILGSIIEFIVSYLIAFALVYIMNFII